VTRYYWYIDANPKTHMGYDIGGRVKRSLTPPSKDYYYIIESVDGYNHVITGKRGEKLSSMNDSGNPVMIKNLFSNITEMLKNKYMMDREEITEETSKVRKTSLWDPESVITIDDTMLLESARRRKRIKARMNAKPPRYRRKTKKR